MARKRRSDDDDFYEEVKKPKARKASKAITSRFAFFNMSFFLRAFALCAIWGFLLVAGVLFYYGTDLPDIKQVAQQQKRPSITLMADDGVTVIARYGDLYGERVGLANVPKTLVQAVVAIEDRRFFDHFGIDVFGIMRAAVRNTMAGHMVQGGSTLTQQLAKNLFLSPDRTVRRKVQEMMLAIWLEHTYTKEQILTAYLNRVYLGSGTYGVDAASQVYFGKPVRDVNLRESAILAGLLRAPSRYAPTNDMAESLDRARVVLGAMVEAGYITADQKEAAISNNAALPPRKPGAGGDGHYFADWIVEQVNGLVQSAPQDVVVMTTLDAKMQQTAERQVSAVISSAAQRNIHQAALVTLAPDGSVKTMVGGVDYGESQFNRATQAQRQPGSSFKPIVYLAAIEQGMMPDDIWEDTSITIGDWSPANYENSFSGSVTARMALAESINTVAVRVLQKVGVGRAIQMARSLGITSPMQPELSLALGTNTVSPLEMAGAYASIASGGRIVTPYAIKEVRTRDDQVLYRHTDAQGPVMVEPQHVATLVDMMTSVVTMGTGKKAMLDRPVAGKTGTTSDYHDAWFIGFTADYTTVVWMGNDNNKSMHKVTGGTFPAQLWHDYMAQVEKDLPVRALLSDAPQNGVANGGEISGNDAMAGTASQINEDAQTSGGDGIGSLIHNLLGGGSKEASPAPKEPAEAQRLRMPQGQQVLPATQPRAIQQPTAQPVAPQPNPEPNPEHGTGQGVLGTLPVQK